MNTRPMNAVVVVSRQPEWLAVMQRLTAEGLLVPRYWVTYPQNHDDLATIFPEAVVHPRVDANRAVPPLACAHLQGPNRHAIPVQHMSHELNTLADQIDRVDIGESMTLGEKRRLADRMVNYWLNVIVQHNIEIGVFGQSPHAMGMYALYTALLAAGRKIRIFRYTGLTNLHFIADRIDSYPPGFDAKVEEIMAAADPWAMLSAQSQDAIARVREAATQVVPWYSTHKNNREAKYDKLKSQIAEQAEQGNIRPNLNLEAGPFLRPAKVNTASQDGDRVLDRNFKVPGRRFEDSPITAGENKVYNIWSYGKKIQLEAEYDAVVTTNLPERFVYFAMHYQPERTTNPDGGFFSDHFSCILRLDGLLPPDVKIVLKEHPSQYSYTGMGDRARWPGYYQDFLETGRCVFVPFSMTSHTLIERAIATATISGMAGWEALLQGKPVLVFGSAWYARSAGVLDMSNPGIDTRHVLSFLESSVESARVDAFAAALEVFGERVYTTPTAERGFEENAHLTDRLFNLLRRSL
jgi:hypothetical protein